MRTKNRNPLFVLLVASSILSCSASQANRAAPVEPVAPAKVVAPPPAEPTEAEARDFIASVDRQLRKLWAARDRGLWVNQNFITEDTEALAAANEEVVSEYVARAVHESKRFDKLDLAPELARQLKLLRLAQTVPAPNNAAEREELAELQSWLSSEYGKGEYCPPRLHGKCLHLDGIEKILRTSHDREALRDAWDGWHATARVMRPKYMRYVELANKGAREIGFSDLGALWRAGYDMPDEAFSADIERLWKDVKPLYDELHCYTRAKLHKKYGKTATDASGAIDASLLGNMWAQDWADIYNLVEPYGGEPSLDVTGAIEKQKIQPKEMVRMGERFFTSLGFDPLPATFWERSLFARPADRQVVCHASAWDVSWNGDLRIKMCIEPTESDFVTIHHELGHDFYFQRYQAQPVLFQTGANDGFHEGIGDTLALSVTPRYLKSINLLSRVSDNPKAQINQQMKMALSKVAFLPFGLLIDKWRWRVFAGTIAPDSYNKSWWDLKREYQGVIPPSERTEADFDPGAKYHVPASTPYIRYFLSHIYQFQFHRALCRIAGHKGPIQTCSIYGNKAAGEKLRDMLTLGASKPWPEALALLGGEKDGDASALLEYFAPLAEWLKKENGGQTCGWK